MEIKTAFATIVGIIMMVTVTVAVIAILGGLTKISVAECTPAEEYTASDSLGGVECGSIGGQAVRCKYASFTNPKDTCIVKSKNLCCPTSEKDIRVINGKCCNITKI